MPSGEMNQPHSEGLTEMPTGGAFAPAPAQGGAEGTRAIKDGGLMPGESQQQSDDAREGDMPGGGMASM
jgi:hypothetical protein